MTKVVLLDAGPLGMVAHPRPNQEITSWLRALLSNGVTVVVPEIADYEVRRELLRIKKTAGIARLDGLKRTLTYLPISTEAMLAAASIWADARQKGRPTADSKSLDADAILAAQVQTMRNGTAETVVATNNVAHLSRFVRADKWENIA